MNSMMIFQELKYSYARVIQRHRHKMTDFGFRGRFCKKIDLKKCVSDSNISTWSMFRAEKGESMSSLTWKNKHGQGGKTLEYDSFLDYPNIYTYTIYIVLSLERESDTLNV